VPIVPSMASNRGPIFGTWIYRIAVNRCYDPSQATKIATPGRGKRGTLDEGSPRRADPHEKSQPGAHPAESGDRGPGASSREAAHGLGERTAFVSSSF